MFGCSFKQIFITERQERKRGLKHILLTGRAVFPDTKSGRYEKYNGVTPEMTYDGILSYNIMLNLILKLVIPPLSTLHFIPFQQPQIVCNS